MIQTQNEHVLSSEKSQSQCNINRVILAARSTLDSDNRVLFCRGNKLQAEGVTALSEMLECMPGIAWLELRCPKRKAGFIALSHFMN
jgi:hypothetical protein